ncbi:MAG: hypothetical protein M3342_15345 [Bacteroidota bacterium]|nr:hypothetical protein [Flavisolibacter sp.]MDQ3845362.1 hypothetical protein [Bacteroidota bacterium]MBD0285568.1 hypothetical protein [Flavisolibacter sp.]MBD0295615.1 hypothetical protein [Flavisolibacter sp.]MBD0350733.1 hypothetical protein [Flavisolibacter sp.]
MLILILLLVTILIFVLTLSYYKRKRKKNQFKILEYLYKEALKTGNKTMALETGKKYYAALRGRKLLPEDKRKLEKEILAMEKGSVSV